MTAPAQDDKTGICLVVEDNLLDQEKMRRLLMRSFTNIKVEVAATIAEARAMLQRLKTSLILLDNNLPDGKGANFAVEIAADPRLFHVPIIIVSDWPSPFMFDKARSAGVTQVVSKTDFGARHIHAAFDEKIKQTRAALGVPDPQARSA